MQETPSNTIRRSQKRIQIMKNYSFHPTHQVTQKIIFDIVFIHHNCKGFMILESSLQSEDFARARLDCIPNKAM